MDAEQGHVFAVIVSFPSSFVSLAADFAIRLVIALIRPDLIPDTCDFCSKRFVCYRLTGGSFRGDSPRNLREDRAIVPCHGIPRSGVCYYASFVTHRANDRPTCHSVLTSACTRASGDSDLSPSTPRAYLDRTAEKHRGVCICCIYINNWLVLYSVIYEKSGKRLATRILTC